MSTIYSLVDAAIAQRATLPYLQNAMDRWAIHPVVMRAIEWGLENGECPDWSALARQWPHLSEDGASVAYADTPEKGAADRWTRTRPGRYIRRWWPSMHDVDVEKIGSFTGAECTIVYGDDIIEAMYDCYRNNGPDSCMVDDWPRGEHPYRVYAESKKTRWGLAVRRKDGRMVARGLVADKEFLRLYSVKGDGIQGFDNELRLWLETNGYSRAVSWEGYYVALIDNRAGQLIMPYIDGDPHYVDDNGQIGHCGQWCARETNGTVEEPEEPEEPEETDVCQNCGESHPYDSGELRETWDGVECCTSCAVYSRHYDAHILRDRAVWGYVDADYMTRERLDKEEDDVVYTDIGESWALDSATYEDYMGRTFHPASTEYMALTRGTYEGEWATEEHAVNIGGEWVLPEDCIMYRQELYLPEDCVNGVPRRYCLVRRRDGAILPAVDAVAREWKGYITCD